MEEEIISQREFARRLGVSEKTIRDGIKTGKIKNGVSTNEKGKVKIIFQIASKEVENSGLGIKIILKQDSTTTPPSKKNKKEKLTIIPSSLTNHILDESIDLLSLQEAIRKKENYLAMIKELEYKEKEGSLVNKEDVYSQLFEFHQEVRNSLLAIPDRITDTVLALYEDRNKVHQLIYESIHGELSKLIRFVGKL